MPDLTEEQDKISKPLSILDEKIIPEVLEAAKVKVENYLNSERVPSKMLQDALREAVIIKSNFRPSQERLEEIVNKSIDILSSDEDFDAGFQVHEE